MRIFVSTAKLFAQNALVGRNNVLAPVLQPLWSAHLFLPPVRMKCMRRLGLKMSKLLQKIMVVVMMMGIVSTSAFAQGRGNDKRPPKEKVKVIDTKGSGGRDRPPPRPQDKPPKDKKRP